MDERRPDHAAYDYVRNGAAESSTAFRKCDDGHTRSFARDDCFGVRRCAFRVHRSCAAGSHWTAQAPIGVTRFRITFRKPGAYPYICALHDDLGMKGKVIVLP